MLSAVGGAGLIAYGLTARGLPSVLAPIAGGFLLLRAVTGHCMGYAALGCSTACRRSERAGVAAGTGVRVDESVTVNKPADELFRFWRRFDNLPKFMRHLDTVRVTDEQRSHWVAKAPLGMKVEWDAEIVHEQANKVIGWQSLPGADVDTAGSVHFLPAAGGRGTEVRVSLKYDPPLGKAGAYLARLFGEAPGQTVREDLERFKQLMEAGVIAKSADGQGNGRR